MNDVMIVCRSCSEALVVLSSKDFSFEAVTVSLARKNNSSTYVFVFDSEIKRDAISQLLNILGVGKKCEYDYSNLPPGVTCYVFELGLPALVETFKMYLGQYFTIRE